MHTPMHISALALAIFGLASAVAEDDVKVVSKPMAVGAFSEEGMLAKGIYKIGPSNVGEVWTNDWIDHFGAFLSKEAVVNDRLFLSGGLGGVFEYRKPERLDPGFYGSQRKGFFIGPTKAMADYHFGDPANPWLTLGAGMFPYKYNSEASDLGEYLYRSGAYPAYTMTGGYVLVNNASADLQGAKSSLRLGHFRADFLLTTETNLAPLYDWSLGIITGYSIADGLLDVGAGVDFKRLIPVKPSRTSKPSATNAYFNYQGKDYTANTNYYSYQAQFYYKKHTAADSAKAAAAQADFVLVDSLTDPARTPASPKLEYFTNAGVLAMARATLDLKKAFASDMFGPEDLKFYSEVALLGVRNYPVFYTKRSERMPIMAGVNLPGFRFLDLISLQVEWFKSPWLNNTAQIANEAIPLPIFPIPSDTVASKNDWNDLAKHDDFKWSLLVQKKIGKFITISGQAANDHMRMVSSRYFYGPQFDHNEITVGKGDWYWMTQIAWGI
ncbi:MAG: hypothetical protein JF616_06095 [Fibrobacteres bacterium]|jgi:hypothetical protein|nr:hypothetical protein [Fibrobacterota bacterium]